MTRVAHLLRQKACQRKAREAERVFFRNIPRTTSSKDVRILENCEKNETGLREALLRIVRLVEVKQRN